MAHWEWKLLVQVPGDRNIRGWDHSGGRTVVTVVVDEVVFFVILTFGYGGCCWLFGFVLLAVRTDGFCTTSSFGSLFGQLVELFHLICDCFAVASVGLFHRV
jgi:hypothetical protein